MKNTSDIAAVILAAGMGKRMQSSLPKVLHPVGDKSMLEWVIDNATNAGIKEFCLVLGGDLDPFSPFLAAHPTLTVCQQNQRRGTGDAVAAASYGFSKMNPAAFADGLLLQGRKLESDYVLICYGDVPGISSEILKEFCDQCLNADAKLGVIGMRHPMPHGYGRLVRSEQGELLEVVEEKDASDSQRAISLCNTGVVFAKTSWLSELIAQLNADNAQNEYYLTDCFSLSRRRGFPAYVYCSDDWQGFNGVNSPEQLAEVSVIMKQRGLFK